MMFCYRYCTGVVLNWLFGPNRRYLYLTYHINNLTVLTMKVKFGSLVVDGRGKIGGHVLSKNRGGAYMRTKVTPINPQTADQSTVRGTLTSLSQSWRALTQNQITAWNNAVQNFQSTDIFGD